jgi:DNA-nicking Smr family endonuclease
MSRRRQLSDEEHALWAGFARSIKPLRSKKAAAKGAAKDATKEAAQAIADAGQNVSQDESQDANQDVNRAAHQKLHVSPQSPARSQPPRAVKSPPLAPFDRRFKQRVARGRDAIDARIDLHGMTQRQAHAALLRFLRGAQAEDAKVVLVVTGKGGGKAEPDRGERGVLRRQVPLWLELPEFRHVIVGFGEAHASHGGQGALYVRLRRAR